MFMRLPARIAVRCFRLIRLPYTQPMYRAVAARTDALVGKRTLNDGLSARPFSMLLSELFLEGNLILHIRLLYKVKNFP